MPCPLPRRTRRVRVSVASPSARPSPHISRVGVRDFTFEAYSGFTHVTACRIAQSPKATFVTRLRPGGLPLRTARQLPAQPTTRWVEPSSTGRPRPPGAPICPGLVAHDLSGFGRRDRMLPEVRMARVLDAIGLHQAGKLSCGVAAQLLGMSERQFRRLRDAYEADGADGLVDRRRGRVSGRRAGVDEIAWVIEEFRTRYFDFTVKHFHEAIHGRAMADGKRFSRGLHVDKERAAVARPDHE